MDKDREERKNKINMLKKELDFLQQKEDEIEAKIAYDNAKKSLDSVHDNYKLYKSYFRAEITEGLYNEARKLCDADNGMYKLKCCSSIDGFTRAYLKKN
jgi:hypothetical protein